MRVYNLLTCALQKCGYRIIPVVLTFYFRYFEKKKQVSDEPDKTEDDAAVQEEEGP